MGNNLMQDPGGPVRILLADDHTIFRGGLRMLLEAEPGFQVVGEAGDGAQAVKLARELKPDILLLDLAMPRYSGLEALRDLARPPTPTRIIVLAAEIDATLTVQLLEMGARALVLKEWATDELIQSIWSVMAGQYWVGHESVASLVQALRDLQSAPLKDKQRQNFGLTPRELEIVGMVVAAYRNKDIAEKFSITEHTVKCHVTHIFNKLGVSNRLELALFALHHHLVSGS